MKVVGVLAVCLLLVSSFGCGSWACKMGRSHAYPGTRHHYRVRHAATVKMAGNSGNVFGLLCLTQKSRGVILDGYIIGLTPGKHGLHVHTFGDVKTDGCNSTGSHYNPRNASHGGPLSGLNRHVGDLGNVIADENGVAMVRIFDRVISLIGPESIYNRAIVVHAKEDDQTPNANPGPRLACGTIILKI